MIHLDGVVRHFGGRTAVDGVDLTVAPGEVVGLLGPNGAGKTTTLRLLLGVLRPHAGSVSVTGEIGYLPEASPAHEPLSVRSHLRWSARLRGLDESVVEAALARHALDDLARRPVARLSKGQRQRVGLAAALLGAPDIVVLDEPTQGLDPRQAAALRAVVREEADRGAAVLLSTHLLSEASAVCDRVVLLSDGHVVHAGEPGPADDLERIFLSATAPDPSREPDQREPTNPVPSAGGDAGHTADEPAAPTSREPNQREPTNPVPSAGGDGDGAATSPATTPRRRPAGALAIAGHDLRLTAVSPTPWVTAAAVQAVVSLLFLEQVAARGQAQVQPLFPLAGFLTIGVAAVTSMRGLADERRSGTLEVMEVAGVRPLSLALGKWLAAAIATAAVVTPLVSAVAVVGLFGQPDWGVALAGFIGLWLLGAAVCGVGVAASSLTTSPATAAAITLFVGALGWFANGVPGPAGEALLRFALSARLRAFAGGAIDSADVGTLAALAAAGVALATGVLAARRAR